MSEYWRPGERERWVRDVQRVRTGDTYRAVVVAQRVGWSAGDVFDEAHTACDDLLDEGGEIMGHAEDFFEWADDYWDLDSVMRSAKASGAARWTVPILSRDRWMLALRLAAIAADLHAATTETNAFSTGPPDSSGSVTRSGLVDSLTAAAAAPPAAAAA